MSLRVLSCGRMRGMRREPEVPEVKVLAGECLDGLARIISKELAPIHSVKSGTLQNACITRPRVVADLEKSALMRIARLMNSLAKGLKKWWQKCSGYAENYTTIGLRISRCGAAEVFIDFAEELRHAETNPTCEIHESCCTSHSNSRPKSFARIYLLRWSSSAQLQRSQIWGSVSGRDRVARAMCREAAWKLTKSVLNQKEHERATFFSLSENRCLPAPSILRPEEREFVVDSRASMHMINKKGFEFCWNGYFDEVEKSYDSHNSQWRSADAWRGNGVCQRIGYILDYESPRKHASSSVARKALRWKRIFLWMGQWSETTSHQKTGLGYPATRRTSFLLLFQVYQRVLPQACPLQHPWHLQGLTSSSSSSTSPTMTFSTASSDSVTRQARRDVCGIDSYPVTVSSKHAEKKERRDPLTKPTKNPKPNKIEDHDLERWDL